MSHNTNSMFKLNPQTLRKFIAYLTGKVTNENRDSFDSLIKFDVKSINQIPGPKPSLPLFGTGWQYWPLFGKYDLCKIHDIMREKFRKYGPIYKEEYGRGKAIVYVCDPKDIETVFRTQGKCPLRPPNEFVTHYRVRNNHRYPSVGIANLNGQQWYEKRQQLVYALRKLDIIERYFQNQAKICDDFVEYVWNQRSKTPNNNDSDIIADFRSITYNYALESICLLCLDKRFGCLTDNNNNESISDDKTVLLNATKNLFASHQKLFYSIPLWKYVPTKSYQQFAKSESDIYDILSKYVCINSESSDVMSGNSCLMYELLKMDTISINEIKVMLIDIMIGGLFTVSNCLNFLCYHLASNQTIQQKLYKEILCVTNDNEKHISHEMLSKLTYLNAFIKESFRFTSITPGVMRILPTDTILSGYHIPSGTLVFSNLMTSCRSEKYFTDCDEFIPERWMCDTSRDKLMTHSFSVLPFGFGNRICPARRLAQLQLKMAIIWLIKHYYLSINPSDSIGLVCKFLIIADRPIKIHISRRLCN